MATDERPDGTVVGMDAVLVDERDSRFEIGTDPAFRVFFWTWIDEGVGPEHVAAYDVTGGTATDVLDWARSRSGGHALVEVWLKVQLQPGEPGIVLIDRWETGENRRSGARLL